jgi:hypothetical protein
MRSSESSRSWLPRTSAWCWPTRPTCRRGTRSRRPARTTPTSSKPSFATFPSERVTPTPYADLADGYAVTHHDALALVAWAVHQLRADNPRRIPTPADVDSYLKDTNSPDSAAPLAAGDLYFTQESRFYPCGRAFTLLVLTGSATARDAGIVTCANG